MITTRKETNTPAWARLFGRLRRAMQRRVKPGQITKPIRDNNPQRYLDPTALSRFGLSPLLAKLVVEGFLSGLHQSPFHGFSVEFADHREYVPGDDLKFIDWHLYARTDHYYIKRYEEETNVRCHILLDHSASMSFGTAKQTKWDYSCFLASCLAYMMLKQQDAVGCALLGSQPGLITPPRCRGSHLRQIMRLMIQNPPAGKTDLETSLRSIVRNIKRRSLVVLISDLIDDPEPMLRAIRLISSHKHDVVVFHVQDPAEMELGFDGSTLFEDLETGEELEVEPSALRAEYMKHVQELSATFRKNLTGAGVDYFAVDTRQPYDHALWSYLQVRARLRR